MKLNGVKVCRQLISGFEKKKSIRNQFKCEASFSMYMTDKSNIDPIIMDEWTEVVIEPHVVQNLF